MTDSTWWWLLTGIAIAIELTTGTFYLLMLSLGMAAAAVAAHAGYGVPTQLTVAALVGGLAVVGWHLRSTRHPKDPPANANVNVHLDIGETVQVHQWEADGTAQVHYRGAQWTAVALAGSPTTPGPHTVVEMVGNRLVLQPQ